MKEHSEYFNVVVVGGGPAGSAAALTLLNQTSLNVGIVESTGYTNMRVGESVSPSILSLMRYLRIEDEFLADSHLQSYGIDAAWGSSKIRTRDFFFTGQGNGWNLDRRRFDSMMAKTVTRRDGRVFLSTKIIDQKRSKNEWCLTALKENGDKITIRADFVIDASGKNASFARHLGAKWQVLDYLVGVASMYELEMSGGQPTTLVESTRNGWFYSTLLPRNKRIVVFMTDSDIAKKLGIKKNSVWNELLRKTTHIKKTIMGAKKTEGPKIFSAYSQVIKKTDFSGWVPAGDAAAAFDPLSSMGIGHAIVSGIEAARVAHNSIKSDGRLLTNYVEKVFENYNQYLKNRRHFYMYEKRWPENLFWKRRQQKLESYKPS